LAVVVEAVILLVVVVVLADIEPVSGPVVVPIFSMVVVARPKQH
jgi:hypothetical protein